MRTRTRGWVVGFALAVVACWAFETSPGAQTAQNQMPAGVQVQKLPNGTTVLANAKGMTLYTFAKDMPNMSHCTGNCAQAWPPLQASADAKPMGDWTILTREDGTRQWAYKEDPLYTWVKDSKPGEATGDGMAMGAWQVAVP